MFYLATGFLERIANSNEIIPVLAIGGGLCVAVIAIVCCTLRGMVIARAREVTKREIAAYVAEGSLDPDKAMAIIAAGPPKDGDAA